MGEGPGVDPTGDRGQQPTEGGQDVVVDVVADVAVDGGDVAVEGVGGVPCGLSVLGDCQGVDRELQVVAAREDEGRPDLREARRAAGLGIDHDQFAVGGAVDTIDGALEAEGPAVVQRHHQGVATFECPLGGDRGGAVLGPELRVDHQEVVHLGGQTGSDRRPEAGVGCLATGLGVVALVMEQFDGPDVVVVGPRGTWYRQGPGGQDFVDQSLEGFVDDRAADQRGEVGPLLGFLEEVDAVCNRAAIIDKGRLIFDDTPKALLRCSTSGAKKLEDVFRELTLGHKG